MSDETETVPAYLEWLAREGYELQSTVPDGNDNLTWQRKATLGSPKCKVNGEVLVSITKVDDTFVMGLIAKTGDYWVSVNAYEMSEAYLLKRGRQIEHRIVDAWREMSA